MLIARVTRGPLDDPDQAHQRPGFLDAGDLPTDIATSLLDGATVRPAIDASPPCSEGSKTSAPAATEGKRCPWRSKAVSRQAR
jgi:hypothetical protein